jgi:hypothetical protein
MSEDAVRACACAPDGAAVLDAQSASAATRAGRTRVADAAAATDTLGKDPIRIGALGEESGSSVVPNRNTASIPAGAAVAAEQEVTLEFWMSDLSMTSPPAPPLPPTLVPNIARAPSPLVIMSPKFSRLTEPPTPPDPPSPPRVIEEDRVKSLLVEIAGAKLLLPPRPPSPPALCPDMPCAASARVAIIALLLTLTLPPEPPLPPAPPDNPSLAAPPSPPSPPSLVTRRPVPVIGVLLGRTSPLKVAEACPAWPPFPPRPH